MRKLKNEELGRKTVEEFKQASKEPIIIVLDNVRSLNNIGSIFRTADAFLIEAIYLCGITAKPPHKDIQKTALGATESVEWRYFENTSSALNELKERGYKIIIIEQIDNSISLSDFIPEKGIKYAIVFGNEITGIDDQLLSYSDECIEIFQSGTKHSLNIAVSVGIVVWDFYNKLNPI
jgi:23S rRNA (guanosine2251-2'-O)-methyltransferase